MKNPVFIRLLAHLLGLMFVGLSTSAFAYSFPVSMGAIYSYACFKSNGSVAVTAAEWSTSCHGRTGNAASDGVCAGYRGPGGTGKTDYWCDGALSNTPPYAMQRRYNPSCPLNSTLNDFVLGQNQTCTPNSGYSAVNNSGVWSVVSTGSECTGSTVYNSATGVCDAITAESLAGMSAIALAALAVALGITFGAPISVAGGLATALAAAIMAFFGGDDAAAPSPDAAINRGNPPVIVKLAPPTPPVKNDGKLPEIAKGPSGKFEPSGGSPTGLPTWTTEPDGSSKLKDSGGKVIATISADGKTATTYASNGAVSSIKIYGDGSSSVSNGVRLSTTSSNGATYLPASVVNAYSPSGINIGTSVYHSSTNVDSTLAGGSDGLSEGEFSPIGGGTGSDPSPSGCGSLSCESTQLGVLSTLSNIKSLLSGAGVDSVSVHAAVTTGLDDAADSAIAQSFADMSDWIDNSPVITAYQTILPENPWQKYFAGQSTSCRLDTSVMGHVFNFDLCGHQDMIQSMIVFMMFIGVVWASMNLIFERPEGK